jgi:hypothetical protein
MLVRGRSKTALCLSVISFLFTPAIVKRQDATHASVAPVVSGFSRTVPFSRTAPLMCNRSLIDQQSAEMATIGQARFRCAGARRALLHGETGERMSAGEERAGSNEQRTTKNE